MPEVLLASAILAFAVAGLSQVLVAGQMHVYGALHEARAVSLLEATMAEVTRLPYADPEDGANYQPGPESGEAARSGYDNIDDYDGWSQAAGALTDYGNTPYPAAYSRFSRSVAVASVTNAVTVYSRKYDGVNITVTVTDDTGRTWTLERLVPEPQS